MLQPMSANRASALSYRAASWLCSADSGTQLLPLQSMNTPLHSTLNCPSAPGFITCSMSMRRMPMRSVRESSTAPPLHSSIVTV